MAFLKTIDEKVAASVVGRWFRLEGSGHPKARPGSYFLTELRAGLATFFAMAYIIAVNANIVADSGGTCVCTPTAKDPGCSLDGGYALCRAEVKRDLVTATAAISALASFCIGLFANLPVALAPGMGLNAYFAYTVVGVHGSGSVPYSVAVTAIFVEGLIFLALALFGMRQWLARAIPHSIKLASSVGIGLFLTLIGLTYSEGLGVITGGVATPLALAGCHPSVRPVDDQGQLGLCPDSDKMRNPTMWIGIFCGGVFTSILMMYKIKGAIIYGIMLVSVISWPRGTPVTYFPYTPAGDDMFNFFRKVVDFHPIGKTLNVQEWDISAYGGQFAVALITFLYVDILDCTGTLYSMAQRANMIDPETQDFERSTVAYMVDSLSISIGALLGTPPVTAFIESGAGISEGGKTGLTAMTTGICFFISIFFAPLFASIPPWATGSVLIIVGMMMVGTVTKINWGYLGDAIPAFITIVLMPYTYSIANGLIGGICLYIILNVLPWLIQKASGGRFVPVGKDEKEPWSVKGGILSPWMVRLSKGKNPIRADEPASDGSHEFVVERCEDKVSVGSEVGPHTA
ncbi:purine transporter [Diplogelasinospora grovesii]|uniref:Purine transporter n=1 Tax=Diplogelasinospora grovesii TaxID=303347 RepID=A0AAN6NDT2_9PEZI|nr:purine transporter [Diplogelasinospora grovesii]